MTEIYNRFNSQIMSRRLLIQGLGIGSALMMTGGRAFSQDGVLARAKASGVLTVGIANEKPYGFVDADGKLQGTIPEILLAVLEPHGIKKLEAHVADFNALIPGLVAGRFDVVGAGMYIIPSRCKAIAFSNPVTQTGGGLLVRTDNPVSAANLEDLAKQPELKIGTQSGTSQVEELAKAGVPRERIVLFARVDEAVAGLQADRCDVIYFPALQVNELLKLYGSQGITRVEGFATPLNYQAFGVRQSDTDLLSAIDEGVARIIKEGKLLKIIEAYGYGEREIPGAEATASKLCAA